MPAAAAVEVFVAALDLLDDLQDDDANPLVEASGVAQALNASTGLLMLVQRLLLRPAEPGLSPETVLAVGRELSDAALVVGGGQYLDLLYESRPTVTEAEALDVASRKSATLVSCACRIGARLGTTEASLVDLLGRAGWHAGMAAQLMNDLGDVAPGHPIKSDIRRGKKTLPIVAAAAFGLDPARIRAADTEGRDVREPLAASGALHYTWVMADLHRQQAADLLREIEAEHPTAGLGALLGLGSGD